MFCKRYKIEGTKSTIKVRKAQTAFEAIVILAMMLFILLVVILAQYDTFDFVKDNIVHKRIRATLQNVRETAVGVYQQGQGAKTQLLISLPPGIVTGSISRNTLNYVMENGKQISLSLGFDVVGTLPITLGNHIINIESKGGYVVIHIALFTFDPNSITDFLYFNENSTHQINITNIFNETLDFNITQENANIPIDLSSSVFSLDPNNSMLLDVTIFSSINYGRYYDFLVMDVVSQLSGTTQVARLLTSLDVVQTGYIYGNGSIEGSIGFIPQEWDFGYVIPNHEDTKIFMLYSGLNVSRNITLRFNSTVEDWLSFTPWNQNRTATMAFVAYPNDYRQFTVYLKPGVDAVEGNYSALLSASYAEGGAFANLVFERPHDIGPPVVNNTNASAVLVPIGTYVCISSNAYDDVGIKEVNLSYKDNNDISYTLHMNDTANITNATCSLNESDNVYGINILIENPGNYTIYEVSAADFEDNIGKDFPDLVVVGSHKIYGDYPFNGTVREEPNDGCTYGGDVWSGDLVGVLGDGNFVDSHDDGNRCSSSAGSCCGTNCCSFPGCACWMPDYVEFDWPDLGVPDTTITNVELRIVHRDDLTAQGQLNTKIEAHNWRHMILCYDGTEWVDIEPYELSLDASTWIEYYNTDISTCVKDHTVANNMKIRMSYDPFDDTGSMIYVDYVKAIVDTSDSFTPDLWDMINDLPLPVDFTSGLNSTGNTFGLSGASGSITVNVLTNSDFNGPSTAGWTSYGTIATDAGGSTIVFSEDFESSTWSSDWIVNNGGGIIARDTDQHSGTYSLGFTEFGVGEGYIYKSLDLSAYSSAMLRFYYANEDLENLDLNWLDIYNGAWNNNVRQYGPDDNGRHSTSPSDYTLEEVDLTSFGLGNDVRIRFRSTCEHSSIWDKWLIDDITVTSQDQFDMTDYWIVDSDLNPGSPSDSAGLTQSFTSPSDSPESAVLKFKHSGSSMYFGDEAWGYCNLSNGLTTTTVWQEHWTFDIHDGAFVSEEIDITGYIDSDTTIYTIDCGAIVSDSSGRTIIAFDDMKIEITYVSSNPEVFMNDGWDWVDGIYGQDTGVTEDFVTHHDPSSKSDGSSTGRAEIIIGGTDTGTNEVIASGAWGIEFNITDEMYEVISEAQATAYLSFTFYVEDLYLATDGLGMGGAWVKARFGDINGMNYLGLTLDNIGEGRLHYADSTPEIWAAVDIIDPGWGSEAFGLGMVYRSYSEDISSYIDGPGRYYLDIGGKASWEGGSKADDEGFGVYIDNVRIIIKY